jgi:hypothetical protein
MTRCAKLRHCAVSFDQLVSGGEELRVDFETECLGGLEVDHELEFGGLDPVRLLGTHKELEVCAEFQRVAR